MVYNELDNRNNIVTLGPIIHNQNVVDDLKARGVYPVELDEVSNGQTVVIRSHGVGSDVYDKLKELDAEIVDATCPFVKRIHRIVEKESLEGKTIVVIGNPDHPEVKGIVGWSHSGAIVVETGEDIEKLTAYKDAKICIVSQTTFNRNKFQELVEIFEKNSYNISVMNTICDATCIRQSEASELSKKADVMIVIGDKASSNSRKLFEICNANCAKTYFIQELNDIIGRLPKVSGLVGIAAGASTPKYIIEEVQNYVRNDV